MSEIEKKNNQSTPKKHKRFGRAMRIVSVFMSEMEKKKKQSIPEKHKKFGRTMKIVSVSILSLILLIGIAIGILMYVVFTPERLTPIVNKQVAKYLNVDFSTESIDLTFYKTFPNFSIRITNGNIISKVFAEEGQPYQTRDSLLSFSTCYLSFNPVQFLKHDELIIHKVILEDCNAYAFMDSTGKANWEVYAIDTTTPEDTASFDLFEFFSQISLEKLTITSGALIFDDTKDVLYASLTDMQVDIAGYLEEKKGNLKLDFSTEKLSARQGDMKAHLNGAKLSVSGKMKDERIDVSLDFSSKDIAVQQLELAAVLDNPQFTVSGEMKGDEILGNLDFSIKNIFAQQGRIIYSRKLHLDLTSAFSADMKKGLYGLKDAKLAVNGLDFWADGYLQTTNFDTIAMDMDMKLHVPAVAVVKSLIPLELLPILNQYEVAGDFSMNINAKGTYAPEQLPVITASMLLRDGAVASDSLPMAFTDITIDANAFIDFTDTKKSFANINKLAVYWPSSFLKVNGKVRQILDDPKVNATVELASNFTEIKTYADFGEEVDMNGELTMDINADFALSDVMNSRWQKLYISGNVLADKLLYSSPADSLFVKADTLNIQFITNTSAEKSASEAKLGKITLFGQDISFAQSEQVNAAFAKIAGEVTIGSLTNNEIKDVAADILVNSLSFAMGDSIRLVSDNINLKGLLQTKNNKPEAVLSLNLGKTTAELIPDKVDVEKVTFHLTLNPLTKEMAKYFSFSLAENVQPKTDTIIVSVDTTAKQETDYLKLLDELLDEFDFNLLLDIKNAKVATDLIPLQTEIPSFNISLNKDMLKLLDTRIRVGGSNIALSGHINNIQSVVFDKGIVKGNINLSSDLLDCNELLYAFTSADGDGISKEAHQEMLDTIPLLVTIPKNVNVEVNTNIKQLLFNKANFRDVTGRIVVRNQHALLDNLTLVSDIGEIKILMLYEAVSNKRAVAGVDLFMDKVDIKKLIENLPMVDTMFPMLKSFEGIVDCQIVATTVFDSMMNVNIPLTKASCFVHGEDLVLLDGETFNDISKWLFFKNKKRNLIDSLSLEFFMRENIIVFFPFSIQMDRYRAMVGGVQNADMSFDYHISVINSPLPFKMGLNLRGNPDKMKIRPGKAQYKQQAKDADNLNSRNFSNQRKQMYAAIMKSIKDIILAPDGEDTLIVPLDIDNILIDDEDEMFETAE